MAVKRYYTREGFVYVPELKNGRNWNEYREQVLEVARIQNLLGHLAGVEQKPKVAGNKLEEWLQQDSTHEMFNYLATTFRDFNPIPLPTEKHVEASCGDVAADEPLSTKNLPEQKNGSAFEAHASGVEMRDELGKSCTKPNELSVEPPSEERLEDELTKARSNDEAEAAVGAAQQVLSRSIEVEDHIPDMPSELYMARSKLQEQPSSRAGEPLESEHPDVLNGMVEVPNKVEDVDRAAELASKAAGRARRVDTSDKIAQEDQPSKLCNGSTNDLPGARRLLFEGGQAMCTSDCPRNPNSIKDKQPRLVNVNSNSYGRGTDAGTSVHEAHTPNASSSTTNGQSHYTEELKPTIYDLGGTLEWPAACCWKAEMGEGECRGIKGHHADANDIELAVQGLEIPRVSIETVETRDDLPDVETCPSKVKSMLALPIEHPQQAFKPPHQRGRLKLVQSITNGYGVPLEGETIGVTQSNVPDTRRVPLKGELAGSASDSAGESANSEGMSTMPVGHADDSNGYVKRDVPDTRGVLLEGEQARYASSNKENLRGCSNTSRALGMHADDPSGREEPITTSIESTSVNGSLKMASDTSKNIRMARAKSATRNSPEQLQKEPSESTMPWRRVGIGDIDAPTPQNVPIKAPSFKNQDITLGRLASPNEGHVASGVEGKKAGGIGEPTHGKDDTKNSGNIGSERIEAGLLAGDSQDAYRGQNELRRRRGRIKFEAGNVSRKRKCKNVYRGRGNTTSHAREGIGTSHSLTIKPRMQEKCQRHVRHDARSVEVLQSTKSAHSELKALRGKTAAPDDLQGPKECPEDIRNQHCCKTRKRSLRSESKAIMHAGTMCEPQHNTTFLIGQPRRSTQRANISNSKLS
ncbi:hypothetical protein EDD15DRAFT_2199268 [Pisolithus albus]|nr:hypothetical protein EDD15DRAFT_2199268 [Pisolithus albus]